MTDHVDSAPDPGPLSFRLWLPRWDSHDGQLRCRFQAVTEGLTQLNEGTPECMSAFLRELDHPDAKNITWSSERYRTPYFSDFPDAEDWEDRMAMTWAVEIEIDSDADPEDTGAHTAGPHASQAHDATFQDEDEDWERTRDRVWVIAGWGSGPRIGQDPMAFVEEVASGDTSRYEIDPEPLASIDGVLAVDTSIFEGMAALDLGELDFPGDMPRIDAVLARCHDLGLRTNWKDAT